MIKRKAFRAKSSEPISQQAIETRDFWEIIVRKNPCSRQATTTNLFLAFKVFDFFQSSFKFKFRFVSPPRFFGQPVVEIYDLHAREIS